MSNFLNNTSDLQKILTVVTECRNEVLSVEHGGTGASDAATARTNLDVYSKSEVDNAIQTAIGQVIGGSY